MVVQVANYLPSISSAIGDAQPQRTIWQLAIALQLPSRAFVAWLYSWLLRTLLPNQPVYQVSAIQPTSV